jgi:hypothetical protein
LVFGFVAGCKQTKEEKGKVSSFEEKNRIEVTEEDNKLSFKNIGKGDGGLLVTFRLGLSGLGEPTFKGFKEGTLVVAGKNGVTWPSQKEIIREGYRIEISKIRLEEGTEVQIRQEGGIDLNLEYVQKGKIIDTFTITDSKNNVISSGSRDIIFKNGRIKSIELKELKGLEKIDLPDERYIDLKSLHFEIKNQKRWWQFWK